MNKELLVDKYKPESFDDIYGHPTAVKKIKKWAKNWSRGSPPLLLHGPAGTGKTSAAEVVSNYQGWNYVEVNASSNRRVTDVETLVQQIRSQGQTKTLYVLDEVDSMNGNSLKPLYSIIDDLPNPVICTANEKWKVPDKLERTCTKHKFTLQNKSIKKYLKDIIEAEDIDISSRQIGQLSTRNGIRDALNDLQEYVNSEGTTDWDQRDTDDSPFAVIRRVLLNKDYLGNMTPDDMVSFLNENTKNEYDGVEAMRAYQAIAEADEWLHITNKTQDYSWWKYAGPISEEVSNMRITEPYNDWVNVNYPSERRNYTPKSTSDNKQAQFYRELKSENGYSGSFDFEEFRKVILPLLQSLDKKQKKNLALSHSLSDTSKKLIDIDPKEYEEWVMEQKDESEGVEESDISEFVSSEKDSDEETKGIFDY